MSAGVKTPTTIYISPDVLEFLAAREAEGAGSVSEQLEALARHLMPRNYTSEQIAALDQQHLEGYQRIPVQPGEFDDLYQEQVWSD